MRDEAFQVQTRDSEGDLRYFERLEDALSYADANPSVWKVSMPLPTGERVRLVRVAAPLEETIARFWVYEPIIPSEIVKVLK